MQGAAQREKGSPAARRGTLAALLVLAAVGLGFALDHAVPPPGWSQPELVGPPPREQFAAQAARFLEDFDRIVRLPLLEDLDVVRALAERPELLPASAGGLGAASPPPAEGSAPSPEVEAEAAPAEDAAPATLADDDTPADDGKPKVWQPQDIVGFWHRLAPDEREALGVTVEPREGLRLPEDLWPIEEAWERYRQRPVEERLNLQFRLQKFYWFEPPQRRKLLANHRRLLAMPPETKALLVDRLSEYWAMDDDRREAVTELFKRFRTLPPGEQERLRRLVRSAR